MADIRIKTADKVVPVIYAYTTPQIADHDGWTKIGYSEQDTKTRVDQQTHTADVQYKIEWSKNATFDDGSGEIFHDTDFHAYLRKNGIEQKAGTEWFHIDPVSAKRMLDDFRENRGVLKSIDTVIPYTLRQEQDQAVREAVSYFGVHEQPEFLFNAKPRFGKTLSVYDLVKRMNLDNVLIVTNRPAIANSWYDDYAKFLGPQSGYDFVSEVDALKDKPLVLSRADYIKQMINYWPYLGAGLMLCTPHWYRLIVKNRRRMPVMIIMAAVFWISVYRIVIAASNPFMYFSF